MKCIIAMLLIWKICQIQFGIAENSVRGMLVDWVTKWWCKTIRLIRTAQNGHCKLECSAEDMLWRGTCRLCYQLSRARNDIDSVTWTLSGNRLGKWVVGQLAIRHWGWWTDRRALRLQLRWSFARPFSIRWLVHHGHRVHKHWVTAKLVWGY